MLFIRGKESHTRQQNSRGRFTGRREGGPEAARLGSGRKRRGERRLPCMRGYSACTQGELFGAAAAADEVFYQDPENCPV